MIGDVIGGRYEIVRVLGEGGMGAVFEAKHTGTGRRVALKTIHPDKLRTPQLLARFQVEARATGGIESEHVVQVFDVDVDQEKKIPFLAMEYLVGRDLDDLLEAHGKLPQEIALRIAVQVCLGLERAHELGILHRDIKPANLLLSERDGGECRMKIVDFGLAKLFAEAEEGADKGLTVTGMLLGSPHYMSPEQARASKRIDTRTDVWSLGMVIYELLTGQTAFAGVEPLSKVLEAINFEPVPPIRGLDPSIDPGVAAAVERALEKSPDARYESVGALREALVRFLPDGWSLKKQAFDALPPKVKAQAAPPKPQQTRADEPLPAAMEVPAAGAAVIPPTRLSDQPGARAEAAPGTDPLPGRVIPVVVDDQVQTAPRRPSDGTLVAGQRAGAVDARSSDGPPATERNAPDPPVFKAPGIPAPPPPGAAPSKGSIPLATLALAGLAAAGVAVGAALVLRSGGGSEEDGTVIASPERRAAGSTSASATAPVAPTGSASPLAGVWRTERGRLFDAVEVHGGVELRVKDLVGFSELGYVVGEARFTLRPAAEGGGSFDVTDHHRPKPLPTTASYDPASRATCVVSVSEVGGKRLKAKLEGDTLSLEQAIVTSNAAWFDVAGGKIVGCKNLERAATETASSKLSRQR